MVGAGRGREIASNLLPACLLPPSRHRALLVLRARGGNVSVVVALILKTMNNMTRLFIFFERIIRNKNEKHFFSSPAFLVCAKVQG